MNAMDALERCRAAWQKTQDQLDIFSVLNAASDPEPERGAASLAFPLGRSVEDGDGPGGEPARAWLTAATAWHAPGTEGRTGAPPSSSHTTGEAK